MFGDMFTNEPIPINGWMDVSVLDKAGFGLDLNPAARLLDAKYLLNPTPQRALTSPAPVVKKVVNGTNGVNGSNGVVRNGKMNGTH